MIFFLHSSIDTPSLLSIILFLPSSTPTLPCGTQNLSSDNITLSLGIPFLTTRPLTFPRDIPSLPSATAYCTHTITITLLS